MGFCSYWQLKLLRAPVQTDRLLLSVCARRRTSEAFRAPLVMDRAALERLSRAFQSALAVVAGFRATGVRDCRSMFPSRELLAKCCGAFYELEIHGTVVGGDVESVELALTVPKLRQAPVVHLIDRDIEVFAADLADAVEVMRGGCEQPGGRMRPS